VAEEINGKSNSDFLKKVHLDDPRDDSTPAIYRFILTVKEKAGAFSCGIKFQPW